ncbi:hypothetical protein HaLaN_27077 [Haematococcus lacustris]|uniref:Uncharacterized protein n=1 Tax=Haematococcus lacustris TaxID=44745 RepID=A0A6A0A8Y6_HAELA|nr:hypothetical protein HaLaN_27077 [Haematococcus lacustris]
MVPGAASPLPHPTPHPLLAGDHPSGHELEYVAGVWQPMCGAATARLLCCSRGVQVEEEQLAVLQSLAPRLMKEGISEADFHAFITMRAVERSEVESAIWVEFRPFSGIE